MFNKEDSKNYEYFKNDLAGFEFKYPNTIELEKDLTVSVIKIASFPETQGLLGFDQETLNKYKNDLEKGTLSKENIDWGKYGKTIKLSDQIYGQEEYILARFDICSVLFEKRLIFFKNDFIVIITLKADPELMINENPEYFKDYYDCKAWKENAMLDFYNNINNNKGVLTNQWINNFNNIINSITFK
ncbi:MAG: hypothetical protein PHD93_01045 [Candidatus Pacebacteria bacterium]|nr:hypothetical protein [Candidatus Paceibacterota bacterium]